MNEVWNLDPIYKGFEDPAFEADMAALKEQVAAIAAFADTLPTVQPLDGLRRGIELQERFSDLVSKLAGYSSLRQAANTLDSTAGSKMGQIMGLYSGVAAPFAAFKDWASKLPDLEKLVAGDEFLRPYTFLFHNMADSNRYMLPGIGEMVMAKLHLSGGDAWSDMQQYLTSTVPVSYRGTTTNLSSIRNLAYDPDPQVRKDAYEAELACYDRIKDAVAYALNSIAGNHFRLPAPWLRLPSGPYRLPQRHEDGDPERHAGSNGRVCAQVLAVSENQSKGPRS